tara:strand:- start:5657 stop:5971 length:315 start_codon:yes stop_codon:yes gene_type:complete
LKKIIKHLFIGGAIFVIGALLHDFANMRDIGSFLAYLGIGYAVVSFIYIAIKDRPFTFIGTAVEKIEKNKAHDELLKYKKLFDEGILTKEEFMIKAEELKKKIL